MVTKWKIFLVSQRLEEEKRQRDVEIKRREAERKKRHELLAKDGKKSFFELNQPETAADPDLTDDPATVVEKPPIAKKAEESPRTRKDDAAVADKTEQNENDLNALDYEADKDDNFTESVAETSLVVQRAEISTKDASDKKKNPKVEETTDKSSRKDKSLKSLDRKRRSRSKSVEKRSKRRSRSRSSRRQASRRDKDRRDTYRRRNYSPHRDNRRRDDYRDKRVRRDRSRDSRKRSR